MLAARVDVGNSLPVTHHLDRLPESVEPILARPGNCDAGKG